jgi:hypothetical protein
MSTYISNKLYGDIIMIELAPPEYIKYMTLMNAMLYCQFLYIDDKRDWRLPSAQEMSQYKNIHIQKIDYAMWFEDDVKLFERYLRSGIQTSVANYVIPVRTIW